MYVPRALTFGIRLTRDIWQYHKQTGLATTTSDVANSPELRRWLYRPSKIEVSIGSSKRVIELSWDDNLVHQPIAMTFERSVSR